MIRPHRFLLVTALLAATSLGQLVAAGCGSNENEVVPVVDASPADVSPTFAPSVDAAPLPAADIVLVNGLGRFAVGGGAKICVTAGKTLLTEQPQLVEPLSASPLSLPPEAQSSLLSEPVTFHVYGSDVPKPCAEAKALEETFALRPFDVGTFADRKSYVVVLVGCDRFDGPNCSTIADGGFQAEPSVRASVVALDTAPVAAGNIGFQFVKATFTFDGDTGVVPVQAFAAGAWNDGPKPIGAPIDFGLSQVLITPASAAAIPERGYLGQWNGGIELRTEFRTVLRAPLSSFTGVSFDTGKSYVIVQVGGARAGEEKLLVFPSKL